MPFDRGDLPVACGSRRWDTQWKLVALQVLPGKDGSAIPILMASLELERGHMYSRKAIFVTPEKRDRLLNFRVSASEVAILVKRANETQCRSLSEYVREIVLSVGEQRREYERTAILQDKVLLAEKALAELTRIQDVLKDAENSIRKVQG